MAASFLDKLRAAARKGFDGIKPAAPLTAATDALLNQAAWEQDTQTVRHIVTQWPQAVNTASADGLTPLHCAAAGMDGAQIDWLLARGADKNARDRDGNTPLHYAAQSLYAEGTQKLIAAGAAIDARNKTGETPLYFAVMFERPDSLRLLSAAGARPDAARQDGETPQSLAPKDDKKRPGGLSPQTERHDMRAALQAACAERQRLIDSAGVLAADMALRPAPRIRKRARPAQP